MLTLQLNSHRKGYIQATGALRLIPKPTKVIATDLKPPLLQQKYHLFSAKIKLG